MTVLAGALSYPFVVALDLDNVRKCACGECQGMQHSVRRLDGVFPTRLCGVWQSLQVATA